MNGEKKQEVGAFLVKAKESLSAARRILEDGHADFAVSRAYYAAFYAVEALLLSDDRRFRSHSTVIGEFNRHFVKTGLFPREFGAGLNRLFKLRMDADYTLVRISREDAQEQLAAAERIVDACAAYLTAGGYDFPKKDDKHQEP